MAKVRRNLSGLYFPSYSEVETTPVCFEDFDKARQEYILQEMNVANLRKMIFALADSLNKVGNTLNIER